MDSRRFLRSKTLRFLLWSKTRGGCARCGSPLPDSWHADHVRPWSKGGITNIFAMQPLCPRCNLEKSNRMQYKNESLRPGQAEALKVIAERLRDGELHTTIVLPTRYGKSDVIRLSTLQADADGYAGCSLVLSPWGHLRDQLLDADKVRAFGLRYGIDPAFAGRCYVWTSASKYESVFTAGRLLISATISMALNARTVCTEMARYCLQEKGRPLIVHLDECHFVRGGANPKEWGRLVQELINAGAKLVLYTATPIRADGELIPGFEVESFKERKKRRFEATGEIDENGRKGYRELLVTEELVRLRAHHETTFRQAWNEEPSPLCRLTHETIDINLLEVGSNIPFKLSEADITTAGKVLSKIVRNPEVIAQGADKLVRDLRIRQRVMPNAAAIVFTGNDEPDDGEDNAHAKKVRSAIIQAASNYGMRLEPVIVTMKSEDGEAADVLKGFTQRGIGDVLIVKQMGGVGLDCERLKVLLDLSNVRSVTSVMQRVMRVATAAGKHRVGTVITLADPMMDAIWQNFVVAEGGEAPRDWTTRDAIFGKTIWKDPSVSTEASPLYRVDSAEEGGIDDSNGKLLPLAEQEAVRHELELYPELIGLLSKPDIAERIRRRASLVNGNES